MKFRTLISLIATVGIGALSLSGEIVTSFTETFGNGSYDHAPWIPIDADSSLSLVASSTDRDRIDGQNDGVLRIERTGTETGITGARRSLGVVVAADAGTRVLVDFSYERPADGFSAFKPLLLVGETVVAEGVPVSTLPDGNDPDASSGLYSDVLVRLECLITDYDVGKELILELSYFDGNVSANHILDLDAVNFIHTGDMIEVPAADVSIVSEGASPAVELRYLRRTSAALPPLQYHMQSSPDLSPWSWILDEPADSQSVPHNSTHEEVVVRFPMPSGAPKFLGVTVRNKRYGDPGVSFDPAKMDPAYPQMLEWQKAGVTGGVPFRSQLPVLAVVEPTDSAGLRAVLDSVWRSALSSGGGRVILKNGTYTIDGMVNIPPYVLLQGESREGVELLVTMTTEPPEAAIAISFDQVFNAGLANLTIRGNYGTPDPSVMENVKPEFMVSSISMNRATNCWVEDVNIINSGNHAFTSWRSSHVTIRGCYADGSWNKGAGGRGYFQIMADRFLVVENHIRNMRHFGLQKEHCEYNVVFRNYLEQDVNFHDDDNGNNLVEGNRSILPATLGSNWRSMMGPWSVVHSISRNDNFIFNNKCLELNDGGEEPFSDSSVVYIGSRNREQDGNVFTTTDALPIGGTFYPAVLTADTAGE
jgi:hypothetical protein